MIPTIFLVAVVIFTCLHFVPGDPTTTLLGSNATQAQREELREEMGLNDPFIVQLGRYLRDLFLKFDLGTSYQFKRSVAKDLAERLPVTFTLVFLSFIVQAAVGIPLGVIAGVHQNGFLDKLCIMIAVLGASLPNFWIALVLVIAFALRLGWLPAFGVTSWQGWILPVFATAFHELGGIARQTRSQMLEVINSDFITTARSKGLSERYIRYQHALPNALIPVITTLGTRFGRSLGGSVVIEAVFSIPGVGMYLQDAIVARDYPAICGSVTILAVLLCVMVLLTDLAYAFVDPRIKAQYENQGKRVKKDVKA